MTQLDQDRYLRLTPQIYYGRDDGLFFDTVTQKLVLIKDDSVYVASTQLLVGDGTDLVPVTMSGDATLSAAGVLSIAADAVDNLAISKPRLRVIREQVTAAGLTDGGAAIGTKTMSATVPAGARFLASTIDTIVGFAGDVSATLTLGDGTDVDRYNTGTPSVFTTAAQGVDMGVPSGTAWHTAAKAVVATVTSNADITPVLAGGGSFYANLWFLEPI